jgi:hypothetical protein
VKAGALGTVSMLMLAGFAALEPKTLMPWIYVAVLFGFEFWLVRRIISVSRNAVLVGEPPYHFTEEEAKLIERFRFYFTYPGIAGEASSVIAALGLTGLILSLWLTFKLAYVPAILIGVNLLAVGKLTKLLAPLMTLRIAASKGDREALRILEIHDPLWEKIRAANSSAAP